MGNFIFYPVCFSTSWLQEPAHVTILPSDEDGLVPPGQLRRTRLPHFCWHLRSAPVSTYVSDFRRFRREKHGVNCRVFPDALHVSRLPGYLHWALPLFWMIRRTERIEFRAPAAADTPQRFCVDGSINLISTYYDHGRGLEGERRRIGHRARVV